MRPRAPPPGRWPCVAAPDGREGPVGLGPVARAHSCFLSLWGGGFPESSRRPGQWPACRRARLLLLPRGGLAAQAPEPAFSPGPGWPPLPAVLTRRGRPWGAKPPAQSFLSLHSLVLGALLPSTCPLAAWLGASVLCFRPPCRLGPPQGPAPGRPRPSEDTSAQEPWGIPGSRGEPRMRAGRVWLRWLWDLGQVTSPVGQGTAPARPPRRGGAR